MALKSVSGGTGGGGGSGTVTSVGLTSTTLTIGGTPVTTAGNLTAEIPTAYLASPPAIGGSAPAAGAFTTLSASGAVSGTGFSTYLASPPAIGGSAPAAGSFSTLGATGIANLASGLTQAANTSADGLTLIDSTAATVGNQQFSPRLRLRGQGWGTTAPASAPVDWIIENQPVQSTTPGTNLVMAVSLNGGAYSTMFSLAQNGVLALTSVNISGAATVQRVILTNSAASTNGFNLVSANTVGMYANSVNVANLSVNGLSIISAGAGLRVSEGSNCKQGASTLAAGSVVVANTSVTANSRIQVTSNTDGGTPGWLRVSARTAGTSFTITSSSGTDTSVVAWEIFEPSP